MFACTDTKESPLFVVEADNKRTARLNLISHLLDPLQAGGAGEGRPPTAAGARLRPPTRGRPDLRTRARFRVD
jgi:polyphosphate kinase